MTLSESTITKHKKIVFFYEKDHRYHPFVNLFLDSLVRENPGADLIIASSAQGKIVCERPREVFISLKKTIRNRRTMERSFGSRRFSIGLIKGALTVFNKHQPDLIISSFPLSFLASQLWARDRLCKIIYYPFELYGKQKSEYSTAVILAEILGFLLKPSVLITQNSSRAEFYIRRRFCRTRPLIAHNYKSCPSQEFAPVNFSEICAIPEKMQVVLYQGMLSEGRWLERLIGAVKYLRDDAVLVMMGPKQQPWWDENIKPLLSERALEDRLFILESVPHEMVTAYAHAAALGVIIYDDSVLNNIYCEPGKIGDFVHAGVPVIAPGFPSIKPVIEENQLGIVFDDFSSKGIARAMNEILSLPKSHFSDALRKASKFMTWEAQWASLSKEIFVEKQGSEC